MDKIRGPGPEATRKLIEDAVSEVASWPLWKANPSIILPARESLDTRSRPCQS